MENHAQKFKEIPAEVMRLSVGDFELADNGAEAKTAPIKMLARSAEPLNHWYWGRVVHDFAGMKMKSRIPVDYAHNDSEVIGYLNKAEITPEGLLMSGALVPYKDSDRATEIIFKQKQGVPYEASINFSGDVALEEVAEGQSVMVNGAQFEGPGLVIREWSLRGVAVCPYGYDSNTESVVNFSAGSKKFSAKFTNTNTEVPMPENKEQIPDGAEVKAVEAEAVETPEQKIEAVPESVESAALEAPGEKAAPEAVEEVKEFYISKSELEKMSAEFGAEIAMQVALSGGGYAEAQAKAFDALKAENAALKQRVSEGPAPVNFSEAGKGKLSIIDLIKNKHK